MKAKRTIRWKRKWTERFLRVFEEEGEIEEAEAAREMLKRHEGEEEWDVVIED